MSDNTSTTKTTTANETTPITDSSANVPFFKKKSKTSNKNIRKRKKSDTDVSREEDNNSSAVITKERKLDNLNPFVQASKKGRRVAREEISDIYAANKSAITSVPEDIATRSAEWDTETDRDAQALLEKKLAAEEALDDNLYKGANSYKSYIKKRDTAAGSAVSSKIKAGPIRAPSNIRVTSRMDYQPDICKDYKETGYCGYGDSCKFLHDRGDYKSGWQLEREWEEMQGKLKKDPNAFLVESSDEESDEELPFACFICRQDFKNPIITKCGHYFCERCALQNFSKSPKCYSCGAPTNGIFNNAKSLMQKIEDKKKRMAEKGETNKEDEEKGEGNESKNSDDDIDND